MSTTVTFGTCSDDQRKIQKTMSGTSDYTCDIYGECDIMHPVFLTTADVTGYNYCAVFGRYYYITNITLSPGGRAFVHCAEDVLMSNASEILACEAWAVRGAVRNALLPDNMLPQLANTATQVVEFSGDGFDTSFGGYNYLLTVKGGG